MLDANITVHTDSDWAQEEHIRWYGVDQRRGRQALELHTHRLVGLTSSCEAGLFAMNKSGGAEGHRRGERRGRTHEERQSEVLEKQVLDKHMTDDEVMDAHEQISSQ